MIQTSLLAPKPQTTTSLRSFWESMIDTIDYGVAGISPEGTILAWNKAASELFGYSTQEVIGQSIDKFFTVPAFRDLRSVFQQVITEESVMYYETTLFKKGGQPTRVVLNLLPLHDSEGRISGAGVIIMERNKKYEPAAISPEITSSPHSFLSGIAEIDKAGYFSFMNDAFARRLGFSSTDELIGRSWKTVIAQEDQFRATEMQASLISGQKAEFDITFKLSDGSLLRTRLLLIRRTDSVGRFMGAYAILRENKETSENKPASPAKKTTSEQEEFMSFMENAPVGVHCVGQDGAILWANKTELSLLGYTKEEYCSLKIDDLYADQEDIDDFLQKLMNHDTVTNQTVRVKAKDGRSKYVSISSSNLWKNGNFVQTCCFIRDITDQIMAQRSLDKLLERMELEKNKLEQVLCLEEGLNTIHLMDKLVDFVVESTSQVLGAEKCSFMLLDPKTGTLCIKGHKGLDEATVTQSRIRLGEPIAGWVAERGIPLLVKDIEKDERFLRVNRPSYRGKSCLIAPIILHSNTLGVISVADKRIEEGGSFNEVDLKIISMIVRQVAVAIENARLYKQLRHLTLKDPLTGIFNYRSFINSLDSEINRARRYNSKLSLLMIDADDFKSFNDSFGHQAGDNLLIEIGKALTNNLRDSDIPCRYAGDEFAVILPETTAEEAQKVAEKIKQQIEQLPLPRTMTLSIGVAEFTKSMDRYDLILKADKALYQAKHAGKNTVILTKNGV